MDSDDSIVLIKEKIRALVRHAAQSRACVHTRQSEFVLTGIEDQYQTGQILGNWMSLILITGDAIKITLKLHFSHQDIKKIVYPIYGAESPAMISDQQSMDFVKELSNLTAGYLEQIFEETGISLGISLPLGTRGFYEIFADYTPSSSPILKFSDLWCIKHSDIKISGSVMIEISDVNAVTNILSYEEGAETEEDDEEGEFDFL